jgi:hypothetical protein
MKTKLIFTAFAICFSLVATVLSAQDGDRKIDPGILNFSRCIGTWHSDFNSTMDGKATVVDYTVTFSSIASGNGIYMEERATSPEMGTYTCGNLIGYDPYGKRLHWFSVDNMGSTHDHSVVWKSPDHFVMSHSSMRNGKKYTEDLDGIIKSDRAMDLTFVAKLDGKVTEKGQGTFERVSK